MIDDIEDGKEVNEMKVQAGFELTDLLYSLFGGLEWHENEPSPSVPDDQENIQEVAFLCVIDWRHFNPRLIAMTPTFQICYPDSTGGWMSHDDLGLCGPVKCVRAWARI